MESDSESEQLRARFEALKIPTGVHDGLAKPQLSPTVAPIDRAALDADLRQRLHALGMSGSDTGTEIDEEELERFLASEDEWYEDCNDPATRAELTNEVRNIMSQLQGSLPGAQPRTPHRRDSARTISSVPNRFYSGDSDADDEGTADEAERKSRGEELCVSQGSSAQPSPRGPLVVPVKSDLGNGSDEDDDDDQSIKGDASNHPGLRTPPSSSSHHSHQKRDSTDTVGRYEALFSSLETPRALPVMTPMEEDDPLPAAFARLQGISPHTGKIGEAGHPKEDGKANLGPVPKLDIEGWRASKDDKPDTWCCICNADATIKCSGCEDDLYCKSCYDEGHSKMAFDASEHKPIEYHGPV
ncbi:hypothetical protein FRB94_003928 [Tulasnella sp. JGI-2019a]|nr:hypothetical protein FRB93_009255 [Tulasnella sp. JGI-2019a]KAG9013094.1 hypothetical protein FRB94_003928 [Tulasnella sp. JGI-2019a]KAG9032764.1 hypothetical protein FRB95_001023 [Tulasnella sp. JGI-2019a]